MKKRLIKNTKNKKFIPTIALQANYSINNIIAEGAGSSYPDFGTIDSNTQKALGPIVGAFGNPDKFNWSVALGFSLPIYTGGELKIDKKIAENSIEVLKKVNFKRVKYVASILINKEDLDKLFTSDIRINIKDRFYEKFNTIIDEKESNEKLNDFSLSELLYMLLLSILYPTF